MSEIFTIAKTSFIGAIEKFVLSIKHLRDLNKIKFESLRKWLNFQVCCSAFQFVLAQLNVANSFKVKKII